MRSCVAFPLPLRTHEHDTSLNVVVDDVTRPRGFGAAATDIAKGHTGSTPARDAGVAGAMGSRFGGPAGVNVETLSPGGPPSLVPRFADLGKAAMEQPDGAGMTAHQKQLQQGSAHKV